MTQVGTKMSNFLDIKPINDKKNERILASDELLDPSIQKEANQDGLNLSTEGKSGETTRRYWQTVKNKLSNRKGGGSNNNTMSQL
jgi:hypothetical protein